MKKFVKEFSYEAMNYFKNCVDDQKMTDLCHDNYEENKKHTVLIWYILHLIFVLGYEPWQNR